MICVPSLLRGTGCCGRGVALQGRRHQYVGGEAQHAHTLGSTGAGEEDHLRESARFGGDSELNRT